MAFSMQFDLSNRYAGDTADVMAVFRAGANLYRSGKGDHSLFDLLRIRLFRSVDRKMGNWQLAVETKCSGRCPGAGAYQDLGRDWI